MLSSSPSSSVSSSQLYGQTSSDPNADKSIGKSVFDGLTANRRSCIDCGYTEAVMHFAFDNWQLSVPHYAKCRLEECLADYTRLEILNDCICRKCSLVATHRRLSHELKTLEQALNAASSSKGHDPNGDKPVKKPSNSKKRRAKEVAKMEARVRSALEEGRIEDDLKDVRMEKVVSRASTKQAMIARPPPVLALHLNRSSYGGYAAKNNVFVIFPEILDLTPYTTSGKLSVSPNVPISSPPTLPFPLPPRSLTPTPAAYDQVREKVLYRLSAVVCHYGSHSFGHYVCFRRKPRPMSKDGRWAPPTIAHPMTTDSTHGSDAETEAVSERAKLSQEPKITNFFDANKPAALNLAEQLTWENEDPAMHKPGRGWLRVSDDSVSECGIESVLREGSGAFMLYYERIVIAHVGLYPPMHRMDSSATGLSVSSYSPRSSEETLRPELRTIQLNGSVQSLVSEVGVGVQRKDTGEKDLKHGLQQDGAASWHGSMSTGSSPPGLGISPRLIRSVAAGRSRSTSAAPPDSQPPRNEESSTGTLKGKEKLVHRVSNGDASGGLLLPPSRGSATQSPSQKPSTSVLSSSKPSAATDSARNNKRPPAAPRLPSPQPPPPPSQPVGLKA
ncbi:hypothetical protein HGRIS_009293 [Hohenbuehelia grisea]|uniref:ubiquitinyl hydrolase 1 n=1 Tax=Hohenbuehelia grisea TaxID=104357 RepID=A0ABR3J129_9AGAR